MGAIDTQAALGVAGRAGALRRGDLCDRCETSTDTFSGCLVDIRNRVAASFDAQGLMKTLGATLIEAVEGEVHIELPFSEVLSQQHGFVHAGAISSVLDSACGYAALTVAPSGLEVVTAEFKINFVRPAIGERFVATGRVQNAGKRLSVCTGEVLGYTGGEPKVIAIMQATVVNVDANQPT